MSTPFLDTQLSIPLLILMTGWLLILAWRKRSGVVESLKCAAPGLCAFVFFVWISLSPRSFELLPSIAKMLQIAYRAVTYQDLSLLFAALSLFALLRRRRDGSLFAGRPVAAALLACCVALAGVGVVVKYRHATPIMQLDVRPGPRTKGSQRRQWAHLPAQFYGASAYATPSLYKELTAEEKASTKRVQISIGVGDDFSIPRPLELSLPTASWIVTNVQAFPWNRIEIDGTAIPNGQLRVDTVFLAAFVPAGNHMLALHTDPDAVWLVLRAISFATLALWLAGVVYLNLKACRRSV